VRRMREEDLDHVLSIEEASFRSPWSRKYFETELEKDFGYCVVAVAEKKVVGYLIAWFVSDKIHVANIAVHPDWRNLGVGEMLIRKVMLDGEGFSWVGLEVRSSNKAARALYKKLGFRDVGIRKDYYVQEREDAVLMLKRLPPEA